MVSGIENFLFCFWFAPLAMASFLDPDTEAGKLDSLVALDFVQAVLVCVAGSRGFLNRRLFVGVQERPALCTIGEMVLRLFLEVEGRCAVSIFVLENNVNRLSAGGD